MKYFGFYIRNFNLEPYSIRCLQILIVVNVASICDVRHMTVYKQIYQMLISWRFSLNLQHVTCVSHSKDRYVQKPRLLTSVILKEIGWAFRKS